MNPKSLQNLKPFTSDNQPPGAKKSRKGIPNRKTDIDKWLDVKTQIKNPVTDKLERGTVRDEVIIKAIAEARKGNIKALAIILDSSYGKITEKKEITGADGKDLIPPKVIVEIVNGT